MKKFNVRALFLTLLVSASLSSFLYINSVSITEIAADQGEVNCEDNPEVQTEIFLPDIHLLKKVFETGKRFLHTM